MLRSVLTCLYVICCVSSYRVHRAAAAAAAAAATVRDRTYLSLSLTNKSRRCQLYLFRLFRDPEVAGGLRFSRRVVLTAVTTGFLSSVPTLCCTPRWDALSALPSVERPTDPRRLSDSSEWKARRRREKSNCFSSVNRALYSLEDSLMILTTGLNDRE